MSYTFLNGCITTIRISKIIEIAIKHTKPPFIERLFFFYLIIYTLRIWVTESDLFVTWSYKRVSFDPGVATKSLYLTYLFFLIKYLYLNNISLLIDHA